MTIDVDSTICQVYGIRKQGAEFGHTKVRGYHPLLAFAAGTWDLLHGHNPETPHRSWGMSGA